MLFCFSLGILIFTIGASLFWRRSFDNGLRNYESARIYKYVIKEISFLRKKKFFLYFFIFSIFLIFFLLFYQSVQQYQLWSQNEVSQYLLPPHQSINYFIFYVLARFFAPYLISLTIAVLFLFSAKTFNKKYQERFFEPEELYFGALAIFLVSHPGWIFYLIFLTLLYLLIHLYSLFIIHNSLRCLSLYYWWLPAAIFVIIISKWLASAPLWDLLKI